VEDFSSKQIDCFCGFPRANSYPGTGLDHLTEMEGTLQLASGAVRRMQRLEALGSIIAVLQVPLGCCTLNGESSA
jgi:hypothetical protein